MKHRATPMADRNRPRRPGRRGDNGAVLVEAAIIIPIFLSIVLGIFTGGVAYNRSNAMHDAAREAGRYGATLKIGDMTTWLNDVADVAKRAADGTLPDDAEGQYICVAYVNPDATTTSRVVETNGTRVHTLNDNTATCFTDGRADDEQRVQVRVERRSAIRTIITTHNITISAESVNRFERT